ncbi:MAG: ABC transporter permease, partial [Candidatus Thorarchaeota archaeon]
MEQRSRLEYALLAVPILLLTAVILVPVTVVVLDGLLFRMDTSFVEVITSTVNRFTITFTFVQAAASTVLSVLIGLPGAFFLARLRFRGKRVVRALLIVPFVLPPIVVVVGFIQMFGQSGILDSTLMFLLGSETSVINLATGVPAIILAHAFYNAPLVILLVSAGLERLNPDTEEAADLLGATSWQKLRRLVVPQVWPSLLAAMILTFLFCFMSFPIVLAFGEGTYRTIEVQIWNAYRWADYGEASSLALIQIGVTVTLAIGYVMAGRRANESESGPTTSIKTVGLREYRFREMLPIILYFIGLLILVAGPIIAIVRAAFFDPITQTYTLDGIAYVFDGGPSGGFLPLMNSLYYAGLATLLAVVLGIPLAYAIKSKSRGVSSLASMTMLLPLGVSSLTIAYGLMYVIAVPLGLNANPWAIIVLAQTVIGLPFSARAIEISLRSIDDDLIDQADALGASRFQRLFFVELPLLAPGILVGGIFAFAMAI